jgi:hypothetical protein
MSRIFITGDTHANIDIWQVDAFSEIHQDLTRDDFLIVLGDFGALWFGDSRDDKLLQWWENQPWTTLFIDGNHENFDLLAQYSITEWHGGHVQFIRPHIIHLMRGQIFDINGFTFFCMGGARSVDKEYRLAGISWWPQEEPTWTEMDEGLSNLEAHNNTIDFILAHTAPSAIAQIVVNGYGYTNEPLNSYLNVVVSQTTFKKMFIGHFHIDRVVHERFHFLYNDIVEITAEG